MLLLIPVCAILSNTQHKTYSELCKFIYFNRSTQTVTNVGYHMLSLCHFLASKYHFAFLFCCASSVPIFTISFVLLLLKHNIYFVKTIPSSKLTQFFLAGGCF